MRCNDGSVVTDDPDDHDLAVRPELRERLTGAKRTMTELLAGAKRVTGVIALGPGATQAAADQLQVVARHARSWLDRHPCPDPAIGAQFGGAFDAFTHLVDECAVAAKSVPTYRPQGLDEKAAKATVVLIEAMFATRQVE